jgi:hypothetical protein
MIHTGSFKSNQPTCKVETINQTKPNYEIKHGKKIIVATTIAAATAVTGSSALAQSAATIYNDPSGTVVTYSGVVSAILSKAGYVSGSHTYSTSSFLVQDATGSLDVYGMSSRTYIPNLGDGLTVNGTYSPYNQIPEIGTVTSVSGVTSGNAFTGASVVTIPQVNLSPLPFPGIAGQLLELNNVTISGAGYNGAFPNYDQAYADGATESYTVTDGSGNSMVLYDWVTSYSAAAALGGLAIPTGPVDVSGIVDVYSGGAQPVAEFIPISVSTVPEPASFGFIGAGALALLALVRRK